jgi:hypothetical protein
MCHLSRIRLCARPQARLVGLEGEDLMRHGVSWQHSALVVEFENREKKVTLLQLPCRLHQTLAGSGEGILQKTVSDKLQFIIKRERSIMSMKKVAVNYSLPTYTAQNYYRIHDITIAYIGKILLSHTSQRR